MQDKTSTAIAISGVLLIVLIAWVAYSFVEAKAYNSATGKHITTWQAMFLELRVQEGAKEVRDGQASS